MRLTIYKFMLTNVTFDSQDFNGCLTAKATPAGCSQSLALGAGIQH
jgi:hypothetical protein